MRRWLSDRLDRRRNETDIKKMNKAQVEHRLEQLDNEETFILCADYLSTTDKLRLKEISAERRLLNERLKSLEN